MAKLEMSFAPFEKQISLKSCRQKIALSRVEKKVHTTQPQILIRKTTGAFTGKGTGSGNRVQCFWVCTRSIRSLALNLAECLVKWGVYDFLRANVHVSLYLSSHTTTEKVSQYVES